MEEMNRRNDQGLGLRWKYIMMFSFCTELFYRKREFRIKFFITDLLWGKKHVHANLRLRKLKRRRLILIFVKNDLSLFILLRCPCLQSRLCLVTDPKVLSTSA